MKGKVIKIEELKLLKENRFMNLLDKNKASDNQRKNYLRKNLDVRRTKSMGMSNFTALNTLAIKKLKEDAEQKIFTSFVKFVPVEREDLEKSTKFKKSFLIKSKVVKNKILEQMNTKKNFTFSNVVNKINVLKKKEINIREEENKNLKNFCDYYRIQSPSKPDENKKINENLLARNFSIRLDKLMTENNITIKKKKFQSIYFDNFQKFKSRSFSEENFSENSPFSKKVRRVQSVYIKKPKNKINREHDYRSSSKDYLNSSQFLNNFYKFKNTLMESNRHSTLMNNSLLRQINTFILKNHKTYWMRSIEDLLSQNVIEHITHGYYKHKSITFTSYKLMSQVEKTCFLLFEDLNKEKNTLFSSN